MNKTYILIFLLAVSIVFSNCNDKKKTRKHLTKKELDNYDKSLEAANRYLATLDAERIESFAKRRNWEMESTKTGLWYMIYEKGSGSKSKIGQVALLNYKISLLDGTLCYSSDSLGAKTFAIGHGGVEPGLEEGILLMHQGDKARLIMPPYRAHGLLGDMNKIPARSIIVYEIELLKLSKGSF
ncbi:MAG: peptidylprolyl isomerase [Bacteroidetes bacterium]|uniref:Peptidyl-prolyl cis-trans isomerase n=1 Tax=Aerophobetes bacterium TaxID=2030807 RepID=A0A662DBJ4_UNCAE|nr:MAG: peptidylprolyl isomerase [Bacteroidota bacterium]RLE12845.1 MAG: peptidylprolyl isomerase [Candidatus Aerophobetes bacterium]